MIRHHLTNKIDRRYTVERWMDVWIGQSLNEAEAWELAQEHYDEHKIDAVYPK